MKKVSIVCLAVIFTAMILFSCQTSQKCPAYGGAKKHQVEKPNY